MGMFKARPQGASSGPELPIDQVVAMKTQGYSNNQIIQTLQRDGYTSSQIFDAISQSEMQSAPMQSAGMQQMGMPPMGMQPQMGGDLPPMAPPDQFGGQQFSTPSMPLSMAPVPSGATGSEEMIEAIIDERWNELVKDINKVIEWKVKADSRLTQMEQQVNDMKDQFDKLHQALIGKIGEYDKNILEVGAELQAMEKVFSKVLPQFVDNVNELSRITDKVKAQPAPRAKSVARIAKDKKEDY